jgi:hypothetical protein
MKLLITLILSCFLLVGCAASRPPLPQTTQGKVDEQKAVIKEWAALPDIVAAVEAQNQKGPMQGLTNPKWQALSPSDPLVHYIARNPTSLFLKEKVATSNGLFAEAFICAARGEKVAFASKPTNYTHAGALKFELPMTGQQWQGQPSFDQSSQARSIQIATPVFSSAHQPIGVLVVGLTMNHLEPN